MHWPPLNFYRLLFLFLFFLEAYPGCAQQNHWAVERLSVANGLSQSDVKCLIQDKRGFLWIGTRDGLNRYDGANFEKFQFNNKDTSALAFNQIYAIDSLQGGDMIIGSMGGISIYEIDHDHFHNHFFDRKFANVIVNDVAAGKDHAWLATSKGVYTFDLAKKVFYVDPSYEQFTDAYVTEIEHSPSRGEWIGTSKGLWLKLPGGAAWMAKFEDRYIYDIHFNVDEALISTNRGLVRYSFHDRRFEAVPVPDQTYIFGAMRAKNGELWIASNRVLVLSPDASRVLNIFKHDANDVRTLSEDRVRTMYETRDGVMWLATFGYGLNKHNPETRAIKFLNEHTSIALSSNYISAIYSANDTLVFIGTSRGVNIADLKTKKISVFDPFGQGHENDNLSLTYAIKSDSNGTVWMTGRGGLYAWDHNKFVLRNSRFGEIVNFVDFDNDRLLLITRQQGAHLFDKLTGNISPFVTPDNFTADATSVRIDRDLIWITANDGLRKFDRAGHLIQHYVADPSDSSALPSNTVKSSFIDSRGNVWIGTWGGGISKYDASTDKFSTLSTRDGLPSNVVYGIIEDDSGILWMSTNNGLAAFDPRKQLVRNFDIENGLQCKEFNTGAFFKSASGTAYFGGVDGLNFFKPLDLLGRHEPSEAIIMSAQLSDDPSGRAIPVHALRNSLSLDWTQDEVTLFFTVIDFKVAGKYTFQYAVNDKPWHDLGNSRRLDLTNLAPGEYKIRIRSSIDGREWRVSPASMRIAIAAPLWKHPLALPALIAIIAGILSVGNRIRISRLNQLNEKLNRIVTDRTREIQLKNEEIIAQNEELTTQTEELTSKTVLLEQNKMELQHFQSELEKRVEDRTRDIQALNRELLHQNIQLEQFSFITAHNFRGPIARMRGLIDLFGNTAITSQDFEDIRRYLKVAIADLENVTSDLNTILNIRGKSSADFKPVDLRSALDLVIAELEAEIKRSKIRISIDWFDRHTIMGINAFVHSVFYNLVENAIKYSRVDTTPSLMIKCFTDDQHIKVEFADNGIGIDLNLARTKMFRLYQRFNYGGQGRGLGLYMVKTQMDMMHGDVTVDSNVGVGTTFTLTFPVV